MKGAMMASPIQQTIPFDTNSQSDLVLESPLGSGKGNHAQRNRKAHTRRQCAAQLNGSRPLTGEFLSAEQAAVVANMSVGWIRTNAKQLGGRKHGRSWRFHRETLIQKLRDGDIRIGGRE